MEFSDYLQIQNLIYSYARLMDRGEFDKVGALFTNGCLIAPAAPEGISGARAVTDMFREYVKIYPDKTPATQHLVSNLIITFDNSKKAEATSNLTVLQADIDEIHVLLTGHYHDRFERKQKQWHFSRRVIEVDYVANAEQLGRHLRIPEIIPKLRANARTH